jgi:superfamily II DNA helicase RecQ
MRLHFITVPIHGSADAEAELNQFLAAHRVIAVDRQLVADGQRSAWAICVTYVDTPAAGATLDASKKSRVDYRDLLPGPEFQVFARLRDLRKQLADKEGVPPYALFTNEQLADMVRRPVRSLADLARLDGVGPARLEKYGRAFLDLLLSAPAAPAAPALPAAKEA